MQTNPIKADIPIKISVNNSGLVILSSYIPTLFDRLGLLDKNNFINKELQADAVHYLQYLVTGLTETADELLLLNKVLCGLPLNAPVKSGINISDENKELIEGLISAAIGHWPAIGYTSIDGFRGNWLIRDGLLSQQEDNRELTVEKRPYDLLLQRSPFSFSLIKFPWMKKPVHVSWPY
jgi:hypothetical protein